MCKKQSMKLAFYVKRTKKLSNGEVPVYMRISINGSREDLAINRGILPGLWSIEKGAAHGRTKEANNLNKYMDSLRYQVNDLFYELSKRFDDLTPKIIKQAFLGNDPDEKTIIVLHKNYNDKVKSLVGVDYRKSTLVRYGTSLKHMTNYLETVIKKKDIAVKKIDHAFVEGYDAYLKIKCGLAHNSAVKYHKNLKRILADARANQWLFHDPYANYRLPVKKTDRGYLDDQELDRLINHEFTIDRLDQVRDCFVVSCFTGLAYSDLERLTHKNFYTQSDGSLWIRINRLKTDILSSVPVLPMVDQIIKKYQYHPMCTIKGKLLPVSSNQRMNAYLKEIGNACVIDKELTTHLARHTFATTVTLNNDVPIESVSKMLGHTSIKTTKIYARLLDKKVAHDMSKLKDIYK
ncbi:site-specific integrase [Bacteroidota bacterium]